MKRELVARLPVNATAGELKSALTKANAEFAKAEKRKVYSEHMAKGRCAGIHFETQMPCGGDRDGDGEIDHRRTGPGGEGRGAGRRGGSGSRRRGED